MLLKASFVILLASGLCNGIYLECDYSRRSIANIGSVYSCSAKFHPSAGDKNISDVSHNHDENYGNDHVEALIFNEDIPFTPFKIHKFFPNLVSIDINTRTTSELTRESLKGLPLLRRFSFSGNELQIIEPDLFIENPLLEWIYFERNPLRHIAFHVFDKLELLRTLYMTDTTCINEFASNPTALDLMKFHILVNCPPTFEMLEEKIVKSSLLHSIIAAQIEKATDPINEALEEIVEEQRLLLERVVALEEELKP